MSITWKASEDVVDILNDLKFSHHPHLEKAKFVIAFNDSKPFKKNRFNWGKVSKFSTFNKLWQGEQHDFCVVLCSDIWQEFLDNHQRKAWLDLQLCRCKVEYIPETIVEGKKKKIIKDEWGFTKYTEEIKLDDNGNPKWFVTPLDLDVACENIKRYGFWCDALDGIKSVLET